MISGFAEKEKYFSSKKQTVTMLPGKQITLQKFVKLFTIDFKKANMRKHQLIILLLLLSISPFLKAQEFAPVGAKWYFDYGQNTCLNNFCSYFTIESVKDTFINNISAKVLRATLYEPGDTTDWGTEIVYSDSDRVYHLNKNTDQFYTLFDFSASPGDTIIVRNDTFNGYLFEKLKIFNGFAIIIDSVSTIDISGFTLRVLHTSSIEPENTLNNWQFYGKIIERIGDIGLFFGRPSVIPLAYPGPLRCYQDSLISFQNINIDCDTIITEKKEIEHDFFKVFPNPTSGFLNITVSSVSADYFIEVYNLSGIKIFSAPIHNKETILNFSLFPIGIYIIHLGLGKEIHFLKLIKY
jgi:hypothetical protein